VGGHGRGPARDGVGQGDTDTDTSTGSDKHVTEGESLPLVAPPAGGPACPLGGGYGSARSSVVCCDKAGSSAVGGWRTAALHVRLWLMFRQRPHDW
jgi:hypothetical protein